MNCEKGDLAIVVRSVAGNAGRIVRVVGWLGLVPGYTADDYWRVDCASPLYNKTGDLVSWLSDGQMRPIRDPGDDATDESKAWLPPVPSHIKERA